MTPKEMLEIAKKELMYSGIDGFWNFFEREDGTFHKEYQRGNGADFCIQKEGNVLILVSDNKKNYISEGICHLDFF